MRIRRRPLPFPPLLPAAPPKPQSTIKPGSLLVQDQQQAQQEGLLLHQDGDLHAPDPPRLGRGTGSSSKGVVRVLHPFPARKSEVPEKEEEEKRVVVKCKRMAAPTPSIHDSNAPTKEEKGKDKKKPKRSQAEAVILEGSRCSRINGRGWRCAQPTLVGYSLCEHHLGKGRSRGPSIAPRGPLGCTEHRKKESGEGSLNEIAPRRKSKARSISSLLDGRTNGDSQLIGSAMKNIGEGV